MARPGHVLGDGPVTIPAHPLAVTQDGQPDWESQRLVTQYYLSAGVTGLAVGVHTTQFEIHDDSELFGRTLTEARDVAAAAGRRATLVAGVVGDTKRAVEEAELAANLGYDAVLVCPFGMTDRSPEAHLERARRVAEVVPVLGFYMQESVGGNYLPESYWRDLFDTPNVVGVKVAPFDRYRTRDVMAAYAASGRRDEIVVITGNDDTIVADLVTPWTFAGQDEDVTVRITGGLLGQWAVGTRAAVELTHASQESQGGGIPADLLRAGSDLITINQALFDTANNFAGAVAGVNEMLRQQGLLKSSTCLSDAERLSPGQQELITAVRQRHPGLLDEEFIKDNLDDWRRAVSG